MAVSVHPAPYSELRSSGFFTYYLGTDTIGSSSCASGLRRAHVVDPDAGVLLLRVVVTGEAQACHWPAHEFTGILVLEKAATRIHRVVQLPCPGIGRTTRTANRCLPWR